MRTRLCLLLVGLPCLVLAGWHTARADLVIFKDGFTIRGKVKSQGDAFVDPNTKLLIKTRKPNSYSIDTGARRIVFSAKQVEEVTNTEGNADSQQIRFERPIYKNQSFKVPAGTYAGFTDWDATWERAAAINGANGRRIIRQRLSLLTPEFIRVDSRQYNWDPYYLTREFDPDTIRKLLNDHPDLKKKGDSGDSAKRFKIFHFLVQAHWYDKALAELGSIGKDFPDEKSKVETARQELEALVLGESVEALEHAQKVGRHQFVQAKLAGLSLPGMDEKLQVRVRALQTAYETINKNLALARRFLRELPAQIPESAPQPLLQEAAAAILAELNQDNINRLEAFANLAEQAERDIKRQRTPDYTPAQLLSLAVSGWLLGNSSAEAKVEAGLHLWRTRRFVLQYQQTHDPVARQRLLQAYLKTDALVFDEMAQLIRSLPPAEPYDIASAGQLPWSLGLLALPPAGLHLALSMVRSSHPTARFTLDVHLSWSARTGPTYHLQLPPEYHHGRSYPVLIVLHDVGEKAEEIMNRWSGLAAENGYLLVAPEWLRSVGLNQGYDYTAEEHKAVVDVLRDLRRRFQVDSDRVFLSGYREGGHMAYDVGLSHPDLFAGVLPMCGRPQYFAKAYWRNGQLVPFYVIDGDMDSLAALQNRDQFDHWVQRGFPALHIQYKGRGMELYSAELPIAFEWMNRKKRASGYPELGKNGDEFTSMRATDNRFYWLEGQEINQRLINDKESWTVRVSPATMQGWISEGNQIFINAHGFKRIVVWLSTGMVDFEKPVSIRVNRQIGIANRKLKPDLTTLLEDFYLRADRQRLYLVKMEFGL